jgi:DNA primase catalytic core
MNNKIYEQVAKFCYNRLLEDQETTLYLKNRGLSEEYIAKFEIGLFPQDLRELFSFADPIDLKTADIIYHASSSRFKIQDLVLPIKNVYGDYIAIAGRTRLPECEREKKKIAKYMNSTYAKSQHLFGLNYAKHSILEKNIAYVVEGYFDVITPHQKGMNNVVAVCGKYLSTRQIALLSRYTDKIVLLFDNEEEAQLRANKIVEKKQYEGISLVAANPLKNTSAKDIDEYLNGHSIKDFLDAL